jgi:hypothetical protein
MVLAVPTTALYQLVVEGVGAQRWSIDRRSLGHLDPSDLGIAFGPELIPLREGPHELSAVLGRRSRVTRVELSAQRPLCIAPAAGWQQGAPLTYGDMARTLVRALGLEPSLPEAGEPLVFEGEHYEAGSAWGDRRRPPAALGATEQPFARAEGGPAEFAYRVALEQPGVYSVAARVRGRGTQLWSLDGRHRAALEPPEADAGFAWAPVLTATLAAGDHVLRALVPRGSGIDRIRLVRRVSDDADYLEVLGALGFAVGAPTAYVTPTVALSNLAQPAVAELASGFLTRDTSAASPLVAVDTELDQLFSRPLSPLLPPEL